MVEVDLKIIEVGKENVEKIIGMGVIGKFVG